MPDNLFKPNMCVKYICITDPKIRKGIIEDKQNFINFLNTSIDSSIDKITIDCILYILKNESIYNDVSTQLKSNDVVVFHDLKVDNLIYTLCLLFADATKESKLKYSQNECEIIINKLEAKIKCLEAAYRYVVESKNSEFKKFEEDFSNFIDHEKTTLKVCKNKLRIINNEIRNL